jgi:hypothetical protein
VQQAGDEDEVWHFQMKHTRGGFITHRSTSMPRQLGRKERRRQALAVLNEADSDKTGRVNA